MDLFVIESKLKGGSFSVTCNIKVQHRHVNTFTHADALGPQMEVVSE